MQTLIRRVGIAVACSLFELRRMLFSNSVCRRVECRLWLCLYSIGRQMSANLCFAAAVRYIQSSKARATTPQTPRKCILVQNWRSLISRWKGNESGRLFALSWTKEKDEIIEILMEARHGVVWAIFSLFVRTMTTHYMLACLILAQIIDSTKIYHLIDGNSWVESDWSADKIRNGINFDLSGQFTYLRRIRK